jgi:hypothetical protein
MEAPASTVSKSQSNPRPWLANVEQKQLLSRHPLFFRAASNPEAYPSNLAHFGIQCGFGWYAIVEELAREIEHELRAMWHELTQFPMGLALVDQTLQQARGASLLVPVCTEISQFAGEIIVIVIDGHMCGLDAWASIRTSIEKAKSKSRETCESCGKRGQYRGMHLFHVYCDECIGPNADQDALRYEPVCVDEEE